MSNKTASGLIAYAKAQLGRPYWMGTFGQTASAALYASNKARLPKYYRDADFPRQYGQRVHDCVGLIKGYLWSDTPTSVPKYLAAPLRQDLDAQGMYDACSPHGTISSMPDTPGCLVFIKEGSKIGHVGVYIGGGNCVEAKGHRFGVVQTALKGRGWTHWGICPYITYSAAQATAGKEDDDMTGKEIYDALNAYLVTLPCPEWAKQELQESIDLGITDGQRPMELIPRYQAAIMAKRAAKGKK